VAVGSISIDEVLEAIGVNTPEGVISLIDPDDGYRIPLINEAWKGSGGSGTGNANSNGSNRIGRGTGNWLPNKKEN